MDIFIRFIRNARLFDTINDTAIIKKTKSLVDLHIKLEIKI